MAVNKTSQATRIQIRDKTSYALPNNPSKALMQPNQIKNYLGYLALLDSENSILSELDRIVDEINGILNNDNTRIQTLIADVGNKTNLTTTQKTNLVNAINELVTAIGTIRTSVNNANARVDDLYRFLADNGLDNDTIISNVNEILAFITTLPETKTLVEYLDEKADKTSLNELKARLEAIADSDDTTLDQFTELINFIRTKAGASELASGLAGKVDKVDGKGLSTNDYDDTEKAKVLANTNARHSHANKGTLDQIQVALTTAMKKGFDTTDQKSLYNLGAYDSVSTVNGITTITRQTGYLKLGDCTCEKISNNSFQIMPNLSNSLAYDDNTTPYMVVSKALSVVNPSVVFAHSQENVVTINNDKWILVFISANYYANHTAEQFIADYGDVYIQYKLATSYTEQVIEGQPLNTLDQNESQILKDDIDNGLNLINTNGVEQSEWATNFPNTILKANTTYTIKGNNSRVVGYFRIGGTKLSITATDITNGITFNTGSLSGNLLINWNSSNASYDYSNIMLVKGSHAYPYVPYNANKHITNAQADLLKDEFDRCSNLGEFADREDRYWVSKQDDITDFINQLPNGTYTISMDLTPLSIDSGYNISDCFFWLQIVDGQYTTGDGLHTQTDGFTSLNQTKRGSLTFTKENYSNYQFRLWGFGNHNGGKHGTARFSNIMLNEGDTALPYKDYEGKIVHEKDLNSLIARIVALENR